MCGHTSFFLLTYFFFLPLYTSFAICTSFPSYLILLFPISIYFFSYFYLLIYYHYYYYYYYQSYPIAIISYLISYLSSYCSVYCSLCSICYAVLYYCIVSLLHLALLFAPLFSSPLPLLFLSLSQDYFALFSKSAILPSVSSVVHELSTY